ncbi:hypothetical protein V8F06_000552 [Rhypophila decipiens]
MDLVEDFLSVNNFADAQREFTKQRTQNFPKSTIKKSNALPGRRPKKPSTNSSTPAAESLRSEVTVKSLPSCAPRPVARGPGSKPRDDENAKPAPYWPPHQPGPSVSGHIRRPDGREVADSQAESESDSDHRVATPPSGGSSGVSYFGPQTLP